MLIPCVLLRIVRFRKAQGVDLLNADLECRPTGCSGVPAESSIQANHATNTLAVAHRATGPNVISPPFPGNILFHDNDTEYSCRNACIRVYKGYPVNLLGTDFASVQFHTVG